ncbi:hypothetical protein CPC08DRAFT_716349 [Agrocybe pediades]|nr:hypothetical protein CPC08DRAFT_716349 [Agrocybe pediades]
MREEKTSTKVLHHLRYRPILLASLARCSASSHSPPPSFYPLSPTSSADTTLTKTTTLTAAATSIGHHVPRPPRASSSRTHTALATYTLVGDNSTTTSAVRATLPRRSNNANSNGAGTLISARWGWMGPRRRRDANAVTQKSWEAVGPGDDGQCMGWGRQIEARSREMLRGGSRGRKTLVPDGQARSECPPLLLFLFFL